MLVFVTHAGGLAEHQVGQSVFYSSCSPVAMKVAALAAETCSQALGTYINPLVNIMIKIIGTLGRHFHKVWRNLNDPKPNLTLDGISPNLVCRLVFPYFKYPPKGSSEIQLKLGAKTPQRHENVSQMSTISLRSKFVAKFVSLIP